jgi:hypothetical protein
MRQRFEAEGPASVRTRQLLEAYEAADGATRFYEDWFEYAAQWNGPHYVVDSSELAAVTPLEQWRRTASPNGRMD